MYNSGYFFSKYINTNLLIGKKNKIVSSFNDSSDSSKKVEKFMIHYIFQYNFLDSSFMSSIRAKFFKYNISITSSKKGVIKFIFAKFPSFFFYNSSFLVSFPIDNYKNIFSNFNLVNDHVCKNTSLSRFSIFPIAIFFNGISIPIEYAHFFFYNAEKLEIFSDNVKFSSFIIMNSYSRQILIFNKFFFNNGNY